MYERFTDRARKVMQLADQKAQSFNHVCIEADHILLGLVTEGSGLAASVLKNLGIDLRKIRIEVEKGVRHGPGDERVVKSRLPHAPRAQRVIEYSIEEARNLNHNYVGTEHLLLGLLRDRTGPAAQILTALGLKLEDAREEVLNTLGDTTPVGVVPHVVVDALNSVLDAPADLTTEQLHLVRERIRHLNEQKDVFVAALDFSLAARCRTEAEALTLLLAWYTRARESQ